VTRLGEFDVRTKRVTSLSVEADSLIITSQSDTQLASQSVSQSVGVGQCIFGSPFEESWLFVLSYV